MKLFYATSISYPSLYANRLQVLHTAEAFGQELGDDFVLGARAIAPNPIYAHEFMNFHAQRGPLLAWRQMCYIARQGITHVYTREEGLAFFIMLYNVIFFRRPLIFAYEAHDVARIASRRLAYVVHRSSHVFSTNTFISHAFAERFPSIPGTVVPNGVDLATFMIDEDKGSARHALDLPLAGKIMMYTGRFTTFGNEKGIGLVLEALRTPALAEVMFVAVGGSDTDVRRYETLAKVLGVEGRAYIRGGTDQATLALYQRAADYLVMYFPNAFHYGEHMSPIKMFEYMASGRPIIASDLPSIREVLSERTALLVPPDRPDLLAAGVTRLLDHPEEGRALAVEARQEVRSYTWDNRAKKIISILRPTAI